MHNDELNFIENKYLSDVLFSGPGLLHETV